MITSLHRRHPKRCNGITETIRNNLKAQKGADQKELVDALMDRLNSSPKRCLKKDTPNGTPFKNYLELTKNSQENQALGLLKAQGRVSVDHHFRGIFRSSRQGLHRVLSADKVSLRMTASRLARKEKHHNAGLLAYPPKILSKKSTGYSTQSEEEALREQNQRFRGLCAAEADRLIRLQKEIQNENKVQLIRRQLYEESIKKLRRIAGEAIFASDASDHDPESIQQSYDECDCLSVTSR